MFTVKDVRFWYRRNDLCDSCRRRDGFPPSFVVVPFLVPPPPYVECAVIAPLSTVFHVLYT